MRYLLKLARSKSLRRFVIFNLLARGLATLLLYVIVDWAGVHYLIASWLTAGALYGFAYLVSKHWIFVRE